MDLIVVVAVVVANANAFRGTAAVRGRARSAFGDRPLTACLPFRTQNRFVATPPFTATRDCNFQRNCDPTRVRRVASFPLSSLLPIPISLFLLSLIISRDHQLTPKWPRAPSFGRASAARTYGEIDRNSIGEKRRSPAPARAPANAESIPMRRGTDGRGRTEEIKTKVEKVRASEQGRVE